MKKTEILRTVVAILLLLFALTAATATLFALLPYLAENWQTGEFPALLKANIDGASQAIGWQWYCTIIAAYALPLALSVAALALSKRNGVASDVTAIAAIALWTASASVFGGALGKTIAENAALQTAIGMAIYLALPLLIALLIVAKAFARKTEKPRANLFESKAEDVDVESADSQTHTAEEQSEAVEENREVTDDVAKKLVTVYRLYKRGVISEKEYFALVAKYVAD